MPGRSQVGEPPVFILAGQSNMMINVPPDPAYKPEIETWEHGSGWKPALSGPGPHRFGPGISFAEALGGPVRLIQCAVGPSSIEQWLGPLWQNCLQLTRAAGGQVTGLLFYQGETDAGTQHSAETWAQRFASFVRMVRQDVGDVPVIFAQIGSLGEPLRLRGDWPAWERVQESQVSVQIDGVAMVQTRDLATSDSIHLDTASQQELGRRFARAFHSLQSFHK